MNYSKFVLGAFFAFRMQSAAVGLNCLGVRLRFMEGGCFVIFAIICIGRSLPSQMRMSSLAITNLGSVLSRRDIRLSVRGVVSAAAVRLVVLGD